MSSPTWLPGQYVVEERLRPGATYSELGGKHDFMGEPRPEADVMTGLEVTQAIAGWLKQCPHHRVVASCSPGSEDMAYLFTTHVDDELARAAGKDYLETFLAVLFTVDGKRRAGSAL